MLLVATLPMRLLLQLVLLGLCVGLSPGNLSCQQSYSISLHVTANIHVGCSQGMRALNANLASYLAAS